MRSDRNDLVVRRIGRVGFGLYASPLYLQRNGAPDFEAGCAGHRLITSLDDVDRGRSGTLGGGGRSGLQTSSHEALVVATPSGGGLASLSLLPGRPRSCTHEARDAEGSSNGRCLPPLPQRQPQYASDPGGGIGHYRGRESGPTRISNSNAETHRGSPDFVSIIEGKHSLGGRRQHDQRPSLGRCGPSGGRSMTLSPASFGPFRHSGG